MLAAVAESEHERFVNHHVAKGSLMADWEHAWRTWVGNAVRFAAENAEKRSRANGRGAKGNYAAGVAAADLSDEEMFK